MGIVRSGETPPAWQSTTALDLLEHIQRGHVPMRSSAAILNGTHEIECSCGDVWSFPPLPGSAERNARMKDRTVPDILLSADTQAAARSGETPLTCSSCVHLTPFELTDELFTCPVVNIRIHRESATVFGCNQHEAAPRTFATDEEVRESAKRMMEKHHSSLQKLADSPAGRSGETEPPLPFADDWRILRDRKWDWHDQNIIVRPFVDSLIARLTEAEAALVLAREEINRLRDELAERARDGEDGMSELLAASADPSAPKENKA